MQNQDEIPLDPVKELNSAPLATDFVADVDWYEESDIVRQHSETWKEDASKFLYAGDNVRQNKSFKAIFRWLRNLFLVKCV